MNPTQKEKLDNEVQRALKEIDWEELKREQKRTSDKYDKLFELDWNEFLKIRITI